MGPNASTKYEKPNPEQLLLQQNDQTGPREDTFSEVQLGLSSTHA